MPGSTAALPGERATPDVADRHRRLVLLAAGVALLAVAVLYRDSFASMIRKWGDDTTFSHGYIILPISLWLAWRHRAELALRDLRPSYAGLAVALVAAGTWIVARGTSVLVVEQAAAVALIPAVVLTTAGWSSFRALWFPLAFLFFAVPVGRALIPMLMQVTADVATLALQLSGVPIYRTAMLIHIPQGYFLVARACGGLGYAITGLVLGVLFAYLTYTRWWKRVLAVLAFLVVPIIANGLRVYVTIGVSYLTNMRYGPGYEHVTFGRIFFILVMLLMFYVGQRWRDPPRPTADVVHTNSPAPTGSAWIVPVSALLVILVAAPVYLRSSESDASDRVRGAAAEYSLPGSSGNWDRLDDRATWKPLYRGATHEYSAAYRGKTGGRVDAYIAVYGPGRSAGGEMISSDNLILPDEDRYLYDSALRQVALTRGTVLRANEQQLGRDAGGQMVWYWYIVGSRWATSPFKVKAYEAVEYLSHDLEPEMIVALSTSSDDDARQRLESFVRDHERCVVSGFKAKDCR